MTGLGEGRPVAEAAGGRHVWGQAVEISPGVDLRNPRGLISLLQMAGKHERILPL